MRRTSSGRTAGMRVRASNSCDRRRPSIAVRRYGAVGAINSSQSTHDSGRENEISTRGFKIAMNMVWERIN